LQGTARARRHASAGAGAAACRSHRFGIDRLRAAEPQRLGASHQTPPTPTESESALHERPPAGRRPTTRPARRPRPFHPEALHTRFARTQSARSARWRRGEGHAGGCDAARGMIALANWPSDHRASWPERPRLKFARSVLSSIAPPPFTGEVARESARVGARRHVRARRAPLMDEEVKTFACSAVFARFSSLRTTRRAHPSSSARARAAAAVRRTRAARRGTLSTLVRRRAWR